MTAEQFAYAYAQRSGVTVEWLKEHGREARPCNCGDEQCEGWQMAHVREDEWFEKDRRRRERAAS